MNENTVFEDKKKLFLILSVSLIMTLASLLILITADFLIGAMGVLFFGASNIIIFKKIILKRSYLKFSKEGIEWNDYSGNSFISKNNIDKIGTYEMKTNLNNMKFFGIKLKNIDDYLSTLNGKNQLELKIIENQSAKIFGMKNPSKKDWIFKSREMSGFDLTFPLTTYNEKKLINLSRKFFSEKL